MVALHLREEHLLDLVAALDDEWDRRSEVELTEFGDALLDLLCASLIDGAIVNDGIGAPADRDETNEKGTGGAVQGRALTTNDRLQIDFIKIFDQDSVN
jgi:hypothetical protein